MKAILEFTLPEDADAYLITSNAYNLKYVIDEFLRECKHIYKYDDNASSIDVEQAEKFRDIMYNIIKENYLEEIFN